MASGSIRPYVKRPNAKKLKFGFWLPKPKFGLAPREPEHPEPVSVIDKENKLKSVPRHRPITKEPKIHNGQRIL